MRYKMPREKQFRKFDTTILLICVCTFCKLLSTRVRVEDLCDLQREHRGHLLVGHDRVEELLLRDRPIRVGVHLLEGRQREGCFVFARLFVLQ